MLLSFFLLFKIYTYQIKLKQMCLFFFQSGKYDTVDKHIDLPHAPHTALFPSCLCKQQKWSEARPAAAVSVTVPWCHSNPPGKKFHNSVKNSAVESQLSTSLYVSVCVCACVCVSSRQQRRNRYLRRSVCFISVEGELVEETFRSLPVWPKRHGLT